MNHGEENALSIAGFASYNVGLKMKKVGGILIKISITDQPTLTLL